MRAGVFGGDDANQAPVVLVAGQRGRVDAGSLQPGHFAAQTDRRVVEADGDVGAPLLRLGDVDQNIAIRQLDASCSRYATRNLLLQVTTARRVLEEVTQVVVERPGPRADLDGALMNRATGENGNQPAWCLGQ